MMLRPRETRDLSLTSFELEIRPAARIDWSHDVAGNAIATAHLDAVSDVLSIRSRTRVELHSPAWPVFPVAPDATSYPFAYSADDRTDLGALATPQYADVAGRLAAWTERFVMARPTDTLSLLKDLGNGIGLAIAYQSRETEGTQGPLETIDRGRGSCRDFAVLFAEAARTLGFGARLASGYLHDSDGSRTGSEAEGSTHAWVEVFVPGAGWIAFDPTNRSVGSANLIPVAVGRRIAQVSPVTGSYCGSRADLLSLSVAVALESP
jgi:transglutaminase-like putative cysteine protease